MSPMGIPRLLVHRVDWLLRGTGGFFAQQKVEVVSAGSPEELLVLLKARSAAAVVVDLSCPRTLLDSLAEELGQKEGTPAVILVSRKLSSQKLANRASRIPNSIAVLGPERTRIRVFEALGNVMGLEAYRQFRRVMADCPVRVVGGKAGVAVNLSRGGAKLAGPWDFAVGDFPDLELELPDGVVRMTVEVRRVARDGEPGGAGFGVQFRTVAPADLARVRALIGDRTDPGGGGEGLPEVPRLHARLLVPRALSLKARVSEPGNARVSYLTVIDLSEGGFLGRAKGFVPPFGAGALVHVELLSGAANATFEAEVLRLAKEPRQESALIGFRVRNIDRAAVAKLKNLLTLARRHGLRGGERTQKRILA